MQNEKLVNAIVDENSLNDSFMQNESLGPTLIVKGDDSYQTVKELAYDIVPTYNEWVDLGFALANGLGEVGRSYFYRVSQFYPSYQVESTVDQYNKCLRSNGQGITIKTFFHLAKQVGICLV